MIESTSDWLEKSSRFIRNPLGIIGLFIALIYGTAVIVSGASPYLTESQRWILVAFDAFFPNLVLFVFYKLVTKHHFKLYAPSDWKDERSVFGPQNLETKVAKDEEEIRQIAASEEASSEDINNRKQGESLYPKPEAGIVEFRRSLRALVHEAEELAFKRLSFEYPNLIQRDVSVHVAGRFIPFDGILSAKKRLGLIEIKVLRSLKNVRNLVDQVFMNAAMVAADFERNDRYGRKHDEFELILVFVADGLDVEQKKRAEKIALDSLQNLTLFKPIVKVFALNELREWDAAQATQS